jgi:hypothetical protein
MQQVTPSEGLGITHDLPVRTVNSLADLARQRYSNRMTIPFSSDFVACK